MRAAARVKTADVVIGGVYAIKRNVHEGLQRFKVNSLITIRKGNAPAQVDTYVTGFILGEEPTAMEPLRLEKRALLGEYKQYEELVAQEEAQTKAANAKRDAAVKLRLRGYELLRKVSQINIKTPTYGSDISIESDKIEAFVKWLETLGASHD